MLALPSTHHHFILINCIAPKMSPAANLTFPSIPLPFPLLFCLLFFIAVFIKTGGPCMQTSPMAAPAATDTTTTAAPAVATTTAAATTTTIPATETTTTTSTTTTTTTTTTTLNPCSQCTLATITLTPGDVNQGTTTPTTPGVQCCDAAGCASLTITCTAQPGGQVFMQFNVNQGGPLNPIGTVVTATLNCNAMMQWEFRPGMGLPNRLVTEVNCVLA